MAPKSSLNSNSGQQLTQRGMRDSVKGKLPHFLQFEKRRAMFLGEGKTISRPRSILKSSVSFLDREKPYEDSYCRNTMLD